MHDDLDKTALRVVHVINEYSKRDKLKNYTDESYLLPDKRCSQPFIFHDKKDDQLVVLQKMLEISFSRKKVDFSLPNEIGLALNIAKNSSQLAKEYLSKLKKDIRTQESFYDSKVKVFYDYLEQIQIAIIFSYKAIESFCNAIIPNDYIHIIKTHRGIEERYGLKEIERWLPTSEKLSDIVPTILKCSSPKAETFWSIFKELENIRNEIIHSKKSSSNELTKDLISDKIFKKIESCNLILQFFLDKDVSNETFPIGFRNQGFKIYAFEDAEDYIEKA